MALLLIAVNIFRVILVFFKKLPAAGGDKTISVPRIFYIYISVFVLIALSILIFVIIGKTGMGHDHLVIWGSRFDIFGNGD